MTTINKRIFKKLESIDTSESHLTEGHAKILSNGKVFYNPVQQFNRDLSIAVIATYSKILKKEQSKTFNECVLEIGQSDKVMLFSSKFHIHLQYK